MKDEIGNIYGRLTVLEAVLERKHTYVQWKCKCECGNEIIVSGNQLRQGVTQSCGCLRQDSHSSGKYDLTGQVFGNLTVLYRDKEKESHLKRPRVQWRCLCTCGNETTVSGTRLRNGETRSCGCLVSITNRNKWENQKFGKLTILKFLGSNDNRIGLWECQCDCGNKTIRSTQYLNHNLNTASCGCVSRSKGETKIYELLSQNNIIFETQKRFDTCVFPNTNYYAHFDFYVNNDFLIEYDGEQHYYSNDSENSWNTVETFHATQARDTYKNQWCKENNIKLKRIPYWMIDTITIEDLLGDKYLIK